MAFAVAALVVLTWGQAASAGEFTDAKKLSALASKVKAKTVPIEDTCASPAPDADPCTRHTLDRARARLQGTNETPVRILHLGDSHVAADLITGMVRHELQAAYGDGGRGFIHIDQLSGYGGRRLTKGEKDWERDRIVDTNRAGRPFGFSGASLESKKAGAKLTFKLDGGDQRLKIYYQGQPGGGAGKVLVDGKEVGAITTEEAEKTSKVIELELGANKKKKELTIVASGAKLRLYGLSFEGDKKGLLYDAIGPVGADAKVYLQLDRASFVEHLKAHKPDLIVLNVGGNDALKSRKGWTNLKDVRKDHVELINILKTALPDTDCLLFGPMDAGDKANGKVTSKALLVEMRDLQREVSKELGCAFYDTLEAMGGAGSIAVWDKAKVMNADLVHPKKPAGDLLGYQFARAFLVLDGKK